MIVGRIPKDDPQLGIGRCKHAIVNSETPLIAHVDGEFLCLPEEQIQSIEVELLPGALSVQCR
jgi:diacylglycerol kinase (ATP)